MWKGEVRVTEPFSYHLWAQCLDFTARNFTVLDHSYCPLLLNECSRSRETSCDHEKINEDDIIVFVNSWKGAQKLLAATL